MVKVITIAVDAMGGDGSPKKIIDGIIYHHKENKNTFYKIFGDQNKINKCIPISLNKEIYEVIHTDKFVEDNDTALRAAKRGKDTSMWLAVESVKNKKSGEYRLSHHLDVKTGMYKGRQVLDPKE